jgi:hypothetical protein
MKVSRKNYYRIKFIKITSFFLIEEEILKNKINEIKDKIDLRCESFKYEIDIQKHLLLEKFNKVTNYDEKIKTFFYYQNLLERKFQFLNKNKRKRKNKVLLCYSLILS